MWRKWGRSVESAVPYQKFKLKSGKARGERLESGEVRLVRLIAESVKNTISNSGGMDVVENWG